MFPLAHSRTAPLSRFLRRFLPLFGLGLLGVASLPLTFLPMVDAAMLAAYAPGMSLPMLMVLLLAGPLLTLLVATVIGTVLAPHVGLRALTASAAATPRWKELRASAGLSVSLGLALAGIVVAVDRALQPLLPAAWVEAARMSAQMQDWRTLAVGLLYGGLTEEITLRWGVMSLLAWLGWKLLGRRDEAVRAPVMWGAIVLAALLFGLGHLPAAAASAPLDTVLVLRTVLLNALAGVVYGWLFWRRHLEAAMLAHASTHVGFALLRGLGLM
ncbi:MAG TPA: CPBP family intramembrane glutamic endopeptidase [Noviherbaspirillum sp.]